MMLRNTLRKLRNSMMLRWVGYFPYFGVKVFTSPKSEIVRRIASEGVFERDIVETVNNLLKPGTWFFDVGANIGVISIPALLDAKCSQVLSIECSPSTFPMLSKTHRTLANQNWKIDNRAVSVTPGIVKFFTFGSDMGAFDGLQNTKRGGTGNAVYVTSATLDEIWSSYESPPVSVLKIDIEGGEFDALMSAATLIRKNKPALIFEWSELNLSAHEREPEDIFQILETFPGELLCLPMLKTVTKTNLRLLMKKSDMFLLLPA